RPRSGPRRGRRAGRARRRRRGDVRASPAAWRAARRRPWPAKLQTDVDLGDLELARRPARDLHGDDVVALAPDQRAPYRRLVGELALLRVRLSRADDRELLRLAGLLVLDRDDGPDLDGVGRD